MGREVGGGIWMGKTCEPKAFSFQCMTKFTTNKKKKERKKTALYKDGGERGTGGGGGDAAGKEWAG